MARRTLALVALAILVALSGCLRPAEPSLAACDAQPDAQVDAAPCTANPSPPTTFADTTGQGHIAVTLVAPRSYSSDPCRPRPLLLYLNGYGADGGTIVARFQHTGIQDLHDVITVAPTGIAGSTGKRRWNASPACCEPVQPANDDVLYLSDLVERIAVGWSVDPVRIYALGMSNGAVMAMRLGCDRPDLFAGVVVIAGFGMSGDIGCSGAHVHVAISHSKADSTALYGGGTLDLPPLMPVAYPAIEAAGTIDQLRAKNGCSGSLQLVKPYAYDFDYPGPSYPTGVPDTDLLEVGGCPADGTVTLWRAPYPAPAGGATYGHSLHATISFGETVWNWIASHPRPAP